jgi:hypothetical protein
MSLDAQQFRTAANILENILRAELDADRERLAPTRRCENGRGNAEIDTNDVVRKVLTAALGNAGDAAGPHENVSNFRPALRPDFKAWRHLPAKLLAGALHRR